MNRTVVAIAAGVLAVAAIAVVGWLAFGGSHSGMHHTDGDMEMTEAAFVASMIPHHQGAVDMAQVVLDRSSRPELRELAKAIIASQAAEIEQMRAWQTDGTVAEADAGDMDSMMHGMSAEDLRSADDVDKAFIDAMIPHHESAVMMADQVKARTDNPEIANLADSIIAAQKREIAQMRQWREAWYGS